MKSNGPKLIKINQARHMVITPVFQLSFPQLYTARSFQDSETQAKSFSLDGIFDSQEQFKEEYKGKKIQTVSLARAVMNVKIDQWGADKARWPKMEYPVFKNGNDRKNRDGEIYAGYEDKWFFSAKCSEKFPPKVVGPDNRPLEENEVYGGCFCRAQVTARPYAFGKNFGVRLLLLAVMKVKDGERFGGTSTDLFDVTEVEDTEEVFEGGSEDGDEDF